MIAFIMLLSVILIRCQQPPNPSFGIKRGALGDSAMVSSTHPLATKIGVEILRKGGNAFDAAVAVHFALQVVFPEAGNIGGGGFAVIRESDGSIASLDFREKAPQYATRDMYLDKNGDVIPMKSRLGHKAAGVPGSVAGMWALHQKYGSMPWGDLVQPSIELAYNGHALTKIAAYNLNDKQEDFVEANRYTPWTVNPEGWKAGDIVKQSELVGTFVQIQQNGRDGFYKGIVADQIEREMLAGGGLILKADLEAYEPAWRKPLTTTYRGHKVISMPPPSSGGVALIQLLQGAEDMNLGKEPHNSASMIHLKTELERRVYADRATYLGDPDFYPVPVEMLTKREYNRERNKTIKRNKKTSSQDIKEGEVEIIESVQTTHYSVADREGNAVSITTTLNAYYGCKVMVKGAGFFMNNEMDDFSAKPGVPNMFGLVGGEANAIEPGKRMLSSMTPTIVEKDNELFMITGTPGGSTIITSVFQSILNVIDYGMTMQEAVEAPRFHSQWLPDRIIYERGNIREADSIALTDMKHELEGRTSLGKIDAILRLENGTYEGAADPRGDDYAEGF